MLQTYEHLEKRIERKLEFSTWKFVFVFGSHNKFIMERVLLMLNLSFNRAKIELSSFYQGILYHVKNRFDKIKSSNKMKRL